MCYTGCVPGSSDGEESACNVGDLGVIPGLGRPPREGNSYLLQYLSLWGGKESNTTEQLTHIHTSRKRKLLYQLIFRLTRFSHRKHSGARTNQKQKKELAQVETDSDPILGGCLNKLWYLATHMECYVETQLENL